MWSFFHGWRRKAGVVSLLLGCVLAGAWVRSLGVADFITWPGIDGLWAFTSENGILEYKRTKLSQGSLPLGHPKQSSWESIELVLPDGTRQETEACLDDLRICEHKSEFLGMVIANGPWNQIDNRLQMFVVAMPYRNVVLPLMLLSAYLILWKPRKRPSPN